MPRFRAARLAALALVLTGCSGCTGEDGPAPPDRTPTERSVRPVARVEIGFEAHRVVATARRVIVVGALGLASVNPGTLREEWRVAFPAASAVDAFGTIWASDPDDGVVRRVDDRHGERVAEIPVPGRPGALAATADAVWSADQETGILRRIDPRRNKVTTRVRVALRGHGGAGWLVADTRFVYAAIPGTRRVVQVDSRTAHVVRRVRVPASSVACGPLTLDPPYVWVASCSERDRVSRVDVRTGGVVVSPSLAAYAGAGLVQGGLIWFAGVDARTGEGVQVALERSTGRLVERVRSGSTSATAVAAFGSWWVGDGDDLAKLEPSDLGG